VDLDQFLAAVEVLRHPELRGKPIVVGGDGDPAKRGVVSTASYEAREHGIHSGQPLRTARKRCPDCVFLPVDEPAYNEVSAEVMAVLRETGRPVEVLGWDEAFMGVDTEDPESFARGIIADVKAATRLDCSVGIGENKLQAKIATSYGKPAGVFRLTSGNWYGLLGARPPDAIWGIGAKTTAKLAALGITTVRELAAADPDRLAAEFGPTTGPWLVLLGRGRGEREVDPTPYVPRSHGREITYQENLADWAEVRTRVAAIARQVASEISERIVARVVVKIRYAPFVTVTHGAGFSGPPGEAAVEAAALTALEMFEPGRPVRLLGVRAEFADIPDDLRPACLRPRRLTGPGACGSRGGTGPTAATAAPPWG
jgi:nucleotidyltransferase/DNA polymerase involved in DNA repair